MPALDFPLEKLKSYTGSSPLPKDFDAYWDKALKELDNQPLDYELEDVDFSAPGVICKRLYFTGVGGARIGCMFLRPENIVGKIPAIAMFHGYSGNSGGWVDKLPYAYAGYAVLAMDVRGQMGLSSDNHIVDGNTLRGHIIRGLAGHNPENLFFRNVYLDTAQTARVLMSMDFVDPERIGATGGSQGGALTLTCAALEPRVKMNAPVYPFLSDYKRTWEMDLFKDAYDELSYYIRRVDPRQQKMNEMFETLGYIDVSNLAPRIKGETYMFITLMDSVCPPSTQFAAYNKITAKKTAEIYPNHAHEALPDAPELIYNFFKGL
ncbi:MAG: acetylxylan esterase [Defluviitaleaceae bacterium]|nr:acetylxylan esterase [Defluviitaleaceae bacterium]